jgi:16S rRNA (uracil1498-N3)-methyltransferase
VRRSRFYSREAIATGQLIKLDSRNQHYLQHVLRVKEGQALVLFDGSGEDYHSTIHQVSRHEIIAKVGGLVGARITESHLQIQLAIAISKGDRMDWVMQKSTELGVSAVFPLFTQRVDVKLNNERLKKKGDHWQEIVIAACEQSGRSTVPLVHSSQSLDQFTESCQSDLKLVLKASGNRLNNIASPIGSVPRSITILIGPEGGLSEEEITIAEQHNFVSLGIGPRILRTETAPIVAISLLQQQWGDF